MSHGDPALDTGSRRAGPLWTITAASVSAAVLTWALQAVVGRVLGPADYAAFMVVWGFVFFEVGLLLGLQQEVTRAVAGAAGTEASPDGPGTSPLLLAGLVGGTGAALLLVTSPLWGRHLFGAPWVLVVVAAGVALLAYSFYNAVNGVLAGRASWGAYSVAMASEGVLRFALVLVALAVGAGVGGQSLGLAGAGLTWAVLLVSRRFRAAVAHPVPGRLGDLVRGSGHAMVATGCSALVIAGFPVLLRVTSSGPLPPEAGVLLALVVATRAPLLLPLNAFSAVLLTHFVAHREHVVRSLVQVASVVLGVAAVGAGAGYLVGPWLMHLLYGPAFTVGGGLVGLLVLAAGVLAVQVVGGSAVLAVDLHRWYAAGWLVSTAVTLVLLETGWGVTERSALALLVGPASGVLVSVVALELRRRRAR